MLCYCGASAFSVFRSNQQSTIPALQVPLSSASGIDSNKHNKHIRPHALEFSANDLGSEATCCCMDTCISLQIVDISWYSILRYIKRLRCGHPQGLSQQLPRMPETEFRDDVLRWPCATPCHCSTCRNARDTAFWSSMMTWTSEPCPTELNALHLDLSSLRSLRGRLPAPAMSRISQVFHDLAYIFSSLAAKAS